MTNEFEIQQTQRARRAFKALCKLPIDDSVLEEYRRNVDKAIRENLDADSIWHFAALCREDAKTIMAVEHANKRHENDPKQDQKTTVRVCWKTWQDNPDEYESKASFARDMLEQFSTLKSQRVIERWCLTWERE